MLRTTTVAGLGVPIFRVFTVCINYSNFMLASLFNILTLKAPIMTAANNIHKYFFIVFQRQRIHLKYQGLFSLKDESKKLKCCLL